MRFLNCSDQRAAFDQRVQRKHFISRQDVRNVRREQLLKTVMRHADDSTSLHLFVHELLLEQPSPVLFYKPVGEEDKKYNVPQNELLLVIATEFQIRLFERNVSSASQSEFNFYACRRGELCARTQPTT